MNLQISFLVGFVSVVLILRIDEMLHSVSRFLYTLSLVFTAAQEEALMKCAGSVMLKVAVAVLVALRIRKLGLEESRC